MQHKKIVKALNDIRPGAEWVLNDGDFEGLEWLDKEQTKPTKAEVETAMANPLLEPELTVQEKLASVGLSIDDLKVALGLEQSL